MITGIYRRTVIGMNDQPKRIGLIVANVVLFFGPILVMEIVHQIRLRRPVALKPRLELPSMSRSDFDNKVATGSKYVVIDNLVLDLQEFVGVHPGGKFVIEHNVGTDISKFFFGGYSLEGNIGQITPGHNHSVYARMIINDLAIAIFEQDLTPMHETLCLVSEKKSSVHAPDVKVLHM